MRQPKKNECPNPNCSKPIVKVVTRFIDNPPSSVVRYSHAEGKTVIGKIYFHEDGTLCDERLATAPVKLYRPVYLRLGDPNIDPRT